MLEVGGIARLVAAVGVLATALVLLHGFGSLLPNVHTWSDARNARLTADGQLRNCLFAREETDLRAALRSGATDDELADLFRGDLWRKKAGPMPAYELRVPDSRSEKAT